MVLWAKFDLDLEIRQFEKMHVLKMYLSLYKFKRREHLYSNASRRALASSRVHLVFQSMELSGKYRVPLLVLVGFCYVQIHGMAWHGEWSSCDGSLHVDGSNFNRFTRVDAIGTYSFQHPDFESTRRNKAKNSSPC